MTSALRRWVTRERGGVLDVWPNQALRSETATDVERWHRELRRVATERDILKKRSAALPGTRSEQQLHRPAPWCPAHPAMDRAPGQHSRNDTRLSRPIRGCVEPSSLVHDADEGSQYTSDDFQQLVKAQGITSSMSRRRECWDNTAMESFFSSMKTERLSRKVYRTRQEARSNGLDSLSPADSEQGETGQANRPGNWETPTKFAHTFRSV